MSFRHLQADTSGGQQIGFAPSLIGESTLRHPDLSLQARLDELQEHLRLEVICRSSQAM